MEKTARLPVANYFLIGTIGYMAADIIHECLGHGGMCLLLGNKISLLNSVYFKSSIGNYLTDIGGPIANVIAGILIYVLIRKSRNLPFLSKWLLLHIMVYNLCWFSGTLLDSIININGDWSHAANELKLNSHITHWLLLIVAVLSYIIFLRMTRACLEQQFQGSSYSKKQLILYPYLFAIASASVAGFFFAGDRLSTAFGGALEMVSSLPFLFIPFKTNRSLETRSHGFGYPFLVAAFTLFILFCLTLGKGIYFA
jgi:hypothetical protein